MISLGLPSVTLPNEDLKRVPSHPLPETIHKLILPLKIIVRNGKPIDNIGDIGMLVKKDSTLTSH